MLNPFFFKFQLTYFIKFSLTLFVFISISLILPKQSFAEYPSFEASNINWDPVTGQLDFDTNVDITQYVSINNQFNPYIFDIMNEDYYLLWAANISPNGMVNQNINCSSTHCTITNMYNNQNQGMLSDCGVTQVRLGLWDTNDAPLTRSQLIPWVGTCTTPIPTQVPTIFPTSSPQLPQIVVSSSNQVVSENVPFSVTISAGAQNNPFNALQANVALSSNLQVIGVNSPTANACNLTYTKTPTVGNPSFAGALLGNGNTSEGCTLYTMIVKPIATGVGTITLSNAKIMSATTNQDILGGNVQNGTFPIMSAVSPTPAGVETPAIDDSVTGTAQNQWHYVGSSWAHCANSQGPCAPSVSPSLYNDSVSWGNSNDQYATITFTGTQITLYGLVAPTHGIAQVSIDNGAEVPVSFHADSRQGNTQVWQSPVLSAATHTLKVRLTGEYIALDSAIVRTTTVSPPTSLQFTINNYLADSYSPVLLSGAKESALTNVLANGSLAEFLDDTSWKVSLEMSPGEYEFPVYGEDSNGFRTAITNVNVNVHKLGDINGDSQIDLSDFSLFAMDWDKSIDSLSNHLSNLNNNQTIDLSQLSLFANQVGQ